MKDINLNNNLVRNELNTKLKLKVHYTDFISLNAYIFDTVLGSFISNSLRLYTNSKIH